MLDAFEKLPDVGFLAADLVDDPNDEASQYRHRIRAHEYTPVEENGVRLLTGPAGGGCAMTSREVEPAGGRLRSSATTRSSGSRTACTSEALGRAGYRAAVLADLRVHHTGGKYYTQPLKEKDEWWAAYWRRTTAARRSSAPWSRARHARAQRALRLVRGARAFARRSARRRGLEALPPRRRAARPRRRVRRSPPRAPDQARVRPGAALPARVDLGDGRRTRFWFSDDSELLALHEIVLENEYPIADDAPVETIVDLGANVGQAALWFLSRHPQARVLSVECDPTTFSRLQRNLGKNPRATLRNAAIAGTDGTVSLERTPHSSWGTRVTDRGEVTVPALSLASLLSEHDIERADLLKVDIEGMEHEALGGSPALERASVVVGELHENLLPVSMEDALEAMRRTGGFEHSTLNGDIFLLSRA